MLSSTSLEKKITEAKHRNAVLEPPAQTITSYLETRFLQKFSSIAFLFINSHVWKPNNWKNPIF